MFKESVLASVETSNCLVLSSMSICSVLATVNLTEVSFFQVPLNIIAVLYYATDRDLGNTLSAES